MIEILIGQSYHLRFDPKLWEAMQPYPPLGALYAASVLRENGSQVALHDSMLAESTREWAQALDRFRPRFAVLYEDSFNYLSKMCLLRMREAAFEMVSMAKARGCRIIVSGSDATDNVGLFLDRGADYVLIGEAEQTLLALIQGLKSGKSLRGLPGVATQASRSVTPIDRAPHIKNPDGLPLPAWDLVDLSRYRGIWEKRHGYYSINMVTSRGCPYGCNWCAKPTYGRRYSARSPENVARELAHLKDLADPDHIWFADDIFGLQKGWIEEFSRIVVERDLVTAFKCLLRSDLVTPEVAGHLRRAGCRTVWVGAESGSQKILDAMEKGTTVKDTYRATRILREAGIEVGHFLQFGYLGESWADILATVQMVRDCMPDDIGISVSYPLPGTTFYDRVKSEFGEQTNWVDGDDLAMLYSGPFDSGFYRLLHRTVHREYRARKAWRGFLGGDLRMGRRIVPALTLPLDWTRLRWRCFRAAASEPEFSGIRPKKVRDPEPGGSPTQRLN